MKITVLGSTGSIGTNTLDVVRQNPGRFSVHALVAGRNVETLISQILEFHPSLVVLADEDALHALYLLLTDSGYPRSQWPELGTGLQAMTTAATAPEVSFVMSAIVGVAGLPATYAAIRANKRIGLANKEVLVASGRLVMDAVRKSGTELIPVDSEHLGKSYGGFRRNRP
jgi:1-deoxy-D-xylulose-5-phosphate reductoisomerase